MESILSQLTQNFKEDFQIFNFLLNIFMCSILLYGLTIVYQKFVQTVSNKSRIAKVLVVLGLSTFLIISIVKSSLALSLGLVGALSIVRFRTAIKEPEELVYFFISIAIGLGLGAGQIVPTVLGVVFIFFAIVFFNKKSKNNLTQNLLITLDNNDVDLNLQEKIIDVIYKYSNSLDIKRYENTKKTNHLNVTLNVDGFKDLQKINKELLILNDNLEIIFIDNIY